MSPGVRAFLLGSGLLFCALFMAATVAEAAQSGIHPFTILSLLVIAMVMIGLIGAILQPPDE